MAKAVRGLLAPSSGIPSVSGTERLVTNTQYAKCHDFGVRAAESPRIRRGSSSMGLVIAIRTYAQTDLRVVQIVDRVACHGHVFLPSFELQCTYKLEHNQTHTSQVTHLVDAEETRRSTYATYLAIDSGKHL